MEVIFTFKMSDKKKEEARQDVQKAIAFIEEKYGTLKHKVSLEIEFRKNIKGSWHMVKHRTLGGFFAIKYHRILVNEKYDKWYTYERKSIGAIADGIKIPKRVLRRLILIHELTHMVQRTEERGASETETTLNEIRYVEKYHPSIAAKLTVIN